MLKIKLARFGKRNQPHYRFVVNEARDKRDGSYVEAIGHYAPIQQPKVLELNLERYNYWLSQGAQPTDTVASLAKRAESGDPFPTKPKKLSKKAKAEQAAAEQTLEPTKPEPEKEVTPASDATAETTAKQDEQLKTE